LEDSKAA
jgi:hypothetical protein